MSARTHEFNPPDWQQLEATILATARAIRHAYKVRLRGLELNLNQASMLAMLDQLGPVTQTELARSLGMGRASAGVVIDSLEKRLLIERQVHPEDRRAWLIGLRPEGKKILSPVERIGKTLRGEIRAGVSAAERQNLTKLLTQIHGNLASVIESTEE